MAPPEPLTIEDFRRDLAIPFELDGFQQEAIHALRSGSSVLVAAPTSSGKTVVADYAVAANLRAGRRTFYTTPIKALSNQKYHDLRELHGADRVGLLTGDVARNGDAPVVVMTTEVLRNMIYAGAHLRELAHVVLDEVHYLQDAYRGPVWEEVIIHLPETVKLVCLSATVSNAEEVAAWIRSVRGPTAAVVERQRPVELENLYLVGDRVGERLHLLSTLVEGKPNPEGERFDVDIRQPGRGRGRRRWVTPRRLEVVDWLARSSLLPAIYFIFSRAACDEAATATVRGGIRLTDAAERTRIRAIVEDAVEALADADLDALGYGSFLHGIECGVTAHHAGMVPPFKEAVERCFVEGLVKMVYATETLALGINMPARTVVIERLTKFTGESHEFLRPADYTQITGRAGRRGIDDRGSAVVLWSPFVPFERVARLAASRSFELRSAFRPTYNMAANLVRRWSAEEAHALLSASFAQFRTDRSVAQLRERADKLRGAIQEQRVRARCDLGDVDEYRALTRRGPRRPRPREHVEAGLAALRPGDVIDLDGDEGGQRAVVLTVGQRRRGSTRVRAVTTGGHLVNRGAPDFPAPPARVGRLELPEPFAPGDKAYHRTVARLLREAAGTTPPSGADTGAAPDGDLVEHPVHRCPDRDRHLAALRRTARLEREVAEVERRISSERDSLAQRFERVLGVLERWGYLDGWSLTGRGDSLARIFHESDLLVAECLHLGLFDGLEAPSLAGVLSCLTYEHRSPLPAPTPWFPSRELRERFERISDVAEELASVEAELGLEVTRPPDPTFYPVAEGWAAGHDLEELLDEEEHLTGGDFVRNVKQLADLLRQVAVVAEEPGTRTTAREAARTLWRGVVAATSAEVGEVLTVPPESVVVADADR